MSIFNRFEFKCTYCLSTNIKIGKKYNPSTDTRNKCIEKFFLVIGKERARESGASGRTSRMPTYFIDPAQRSCDKLPG